MTSREEQYISEWESQVALKSWPKVIALDKFGHNGDVNGTEEDLWPLGGIHTDLTTGTTINVTSDNAADTTQIMRVTGLDGGWNYVSVDVTLNGQTPVQVGDALGWTVIFKMLQVSVAPHPIGDVYAAVAGAAYTAGVPDDVADVQAFVDFTDTVPDDQVEQLWVIVPAGYRGLMYEYAGEIEKSGGSARTAEVYLESAELAKGSTVDNPSWAPYHVHHDLTLSTAAHVHDTVDFKLPLCFPELTRIRVTGTATSSSHLGGYISMVLVPSHNIPA